MKPGDIVTTAIWITGDESAKLRAQYADDVLEAITNLCDSEGYDHGPITWISRHPEDSDIPPVPDHIKGSQVRLLIAEVTVFGKKLQTTPDSFVANLEPDDLKRLRNITRASYVRLFKKPISDADCDDVIEALGPESAVDALRQGKSLH